MDSMATNHVTSSIDGMFNQSHYNGTNKLVVSSGEGLEITNIGNGFLFSYACNLQLKNVLVVP